MRRTERTPIDDDAENAEIRPLEACIPLSIQGRPIGSIHPKHPGLIYPINYGYIPNVFGGDGEELDVYLLGIDVPIQECTARIIGIVHRHNDAEDKLVAAPEGLKFDKNKISEAVHFQEQYYENEIEIYN